MPFASSNRTSLLDQLKSCWNKLHITVMSGQFLCIRWKILFPVISYFHLNMIFFSNFILVAIGNQLCLKFIVAEMEERLKPRGEWGGGGGNPMIKGRGCSSEILRRTPKRYMILFCGRCLICFSLLKGTNCKTTINLVSFFAAQYPKRYH